MQQLDLISQLKALGGEIQVGGGIRSLDTAQACSAAKLDFLVLGSIAIDDRQLTREMIDIIGPERIILALDITIQNQQPLIATHGWQQQSDQSLWTLVEHYAELGVWNYLCTDIAQDGMMAGPNFELYSQAVKRYPTLDWQASGGIRNPDDVCRLASSGMSAVILGRCLYESQYSLQDFIAAATAEGVTSC
jgi:phosphoribosylformimino-5-aminoimidazole carboxamide ribotide isomerase